jgi:hypothetical protein
MLCSTELQLPASIIESKPYNKVDAIPQFANAHITKVCLGASFICLLFRYYGIRELVVEDLNSLNQKL